jgi:hypothetical protein
MNRLRTARLKWAILCLLPVFLSTISFAKEPPIFDIGIEQIYDVLPGHPATIGVICNNATEEITGYDFTIMYESVNLAFVDAEPGEFINRCDWQYFSYRYLGEAENFANVPTGLVRIMAYADSNAGPGDPDCYLPNNDEAMFYMTFKVPPGCPYRCLILPVRFYWSECHDNSLILRSDQSLAISHYVFDYDGEELTDTGYIPGIWGAPNSCLDNTPPAESRLVDYYNGSIQTVCTGEICFDRGDINCDGVPYESGDAVRFASMFVLPIFDLVWGQYPDWYWCAAKNSDVNADGIVVSVADLVYLIRVITGDALPYPKPMVSDYGIELEARGTESGTEIYYRSPVDIGAVMLKCGIEGNAGVPELGKDFDNMQILSNSNRENLGILIYSLDGNTIPAGENILATIPHDASLNLTGAEVSDWYGRLVAVKINSRPSRFEVSQNYPNPFNPSTTFSLYLPEPSHWQVAVYNIIGQQIREFSGYDDAGKVSLTWDGRDGQGKTVAGGIYFYRVMAGGEAKTRKMLLLK